MIAALSACFISLSQAGAPIDVPPSHWAYGAVNELFSAGILHGYPRESGLRLEKIKPDDKFLLNLTSRWKEIGLMVGYPDGMMCHRGVGSPTNYEQAVMMHAVWANLIQITKEPGADAMAIAKYLPDLAKAISMRAPELRKLGAEPEIMVKDLQRIDTQSVSFYRG